MPKVEPDISVVDIENRKRMEEGMLKKCGRNIKGDDLEYNALLRLCRIANVDPTFYTYEEIDAAIQATFERWKNRAGLLKGGGRPA